MDKKEILSATAKELDGIEYLEEREDIWERAAADGIVVVFGYSDDNIELRGAVNDEIGAFEGRSFYIDSAGNIGTDPDSGKCITAVWCGKVNGREIPDGSGAAGLPGAVIPWTYRTDIPCEEFMMYEDGEPFCKGIVFFLDSLN